MTSYFQEPRLSTMVVLYTLPMKLNTDELLMKMPINNVVIKIEKKGSLRRGESKRDRIKRRQPVSTTTSGFGHNSVTVVVLDDGGGRQKQKEVTIKIFHNGVFHLTGIAHEEYEQSAIRTMLSVMRELPASCFLEQPASWENPERRVVLMNFTTSFRDPESKVSRLAIQSYFQEKGIRAVFEPDVDPAVKLRFPEKWTARIFRTGKINLTALTTRSECQTFVERLNDYFREYYTSLGHSQANRELVLPQTVSLTR
jgi:TATA-box binding protein (TBP) (component of TFIID and TFIIIB)